MATPVVGGVYDWDAETYHAERECLTQSGAKKLLAPSCPALFRWWRDHPQPPSTAFDLGHAAHRMVLGKGAELYEITAKDWRTKKARDGADWARGRGRVPLLTEQFNAALKMAAALQREIPGLFGEAGHTEQVIVWTDQETEVRCKAMLDWWRPASTLARHPHDRAVIVDYKTCADASTAAVARSIASYGYHVQAAWYIDALDAIGVQAQVAFVFQEKTEPYLVNVVEVDDQALFFGREKVDLALHVYRDCLESGIWPGYHTGQINKITLPRWAVTQHLAEESA